MASGGVRFRTEATTRTAKDKQGTLPLQKAA